MLGLKRIGQSLAFAATLALLAGAPAPAEAVSAAAINRDASITLARLYQEVPAAKKLAKQAKVVLIFPSVVKGGLSSGGSTARASCANVERLWAITTPLRFPMGYRLAPRASGMSCSLCPTTA